MYKLYSSGETKEDEEGQGRELDGGEEAWGVCGVGGPKIERTKRLNPQRNKGPGFMLQHQSVRASNHRWCSVTALHELYQSIECKWT